MDWDELWASDSDGEVTDDTVKESPVVNVDVPSLPLRLLLTHALPTAAAAAPANSAPAAAAASASADAEAATSTDRDAANSDDDGEAKAAVESRNDFGMKTSLSARRAELFHRSFPFCRDIVFNEHCIPESLTYAPQFSDAEARTIESNLPKCVLPALTPSDHLLLMGLSSITHSLYGGSVASSLDAAGKCGNVAFPP